jgi:hypothetical protein
MIRLVVQHYRPKKSSSTEALIISELDDLLALLVIVDIVTKTTFATDDVANTGL